MTQTNHQTFADYFEGRNNTPLATVLARLVVLVAKWEERYRTRKHLGRLDAHLLKDIGKSREAAEYESSLPCWWTNDHRG